MYNAVNRTSHKHHNIVDNALSQLNTADVYKRYTYGYGQHRIY